MGMKRIPAAEFARKINLIPPKHLEIDETLKETNGDFKRTVRIRWKGMGIMLKAVYQSSELPNIKDEFYIHEDLQ